MFYKIKRNYDCLSLRFEDPILHMYRGFNLKFGTFPIFIASNGVSFYSAHSPEIVVRRSTEEMRVYLPGDNFRHDYLWTRRWFSDSEEAEKYKKIFKQALDEFFHINGKQVRDDTFWVGDADV